MYIVFSTRTGLEDKYGPQTADIILDEMNKVSHAVRLKPGWGSITLLADDPNSMAKFDLKPTLADDPWALKLALADLDKALGKKGLMIGALLIVGGPEVVPYHHLPNPVEDVDVDVPSDNPYATQDENYFIPEWPVGRLPGGKGSDPGVLLDSLRQVTEHHMGARTHLVGIHLALAAEPDLLVQEKRPQFWICRGSLEESLGRGLPIDPGERSHGDLSSLRGKPRDPCAGHAPRLLQPARCGG